MTLHQNHRPPPPPGIQRPQYLSYYLSDYNQTLKVIFGINNNNMSNNKKININNISNNNNISAVTDMILIKYQR